jgi:Nidogen-like
MTFLLNDLGGTTGFGDVALQRNDDGSTGLIDVSSVFPSGLNFFGHTYTGFFINNNGGITFNAPRGAFTPNAITAATGNPEITPFFADVDTRGGPASPTPGGTSEGTNLVYLALDPAGHEAVITWDDVGYFSSHTDKLNAFQLVLQDTSASGSPGDFDISFRYEDINWTTGDASGGRNGLGGTVARAGFSAGTGNPSDFFELPQSGNQQGMLDLELTPGNSGVAGLWEFAVHNGQVALGSDNAINALLAFKQELGALLEAKGGVDIPGFTPPPGSDPAGDLQAVLNVTQGELSQSLFGPQASDPPPATADSAFVDPPATFDWIESSDPPPASDPWSGDADPVATMASVPSGLEVSPWGGVDALGFPQTFWLVEHI